MVILLYEYYSTVNEWGQHRNSSPLGPPKNSDVIYRASDIPTILSFGYLHPR